VSGILPLDPRRNPAWLKLDLFCRGARVSEACRVSDDGGRPVLRTRAGLGSGLELVLAGGHHVNVPVTEPFAASSPYELRRRDGRLSRPGYALVHEDGPCARVRLAPRPAWYDRKTSSGRPMTRVATLQGTYLAVYPARVCDFWVHGSTRAERENCRFCSVGLNLGADDGPEKSVDDVLEVVHAARRESGITYVDFNTGHYDAANYVEILEPYLRRIQAETDLLVGVQTPPLPRSEDYARLRRLGVNRVSFCFEIFDPDLFRETCPGKARVYGLDGYLGAIEQALAAGPRGRLDPRPWVVNGEIIAGLEPVESTMAAVDWLTARGAIPTVCVFRPLRGTQMADRPPPRAADLAPAFAHLYVRCLEAGLPVGVAPNVKVSLVLLPEECRGLVRNRAALEALRGRERSLAVKRLAVAAGFYGRRRVRATPSRS
jgi:hypothetical protein